MRDRLAIIHTGQKLGVCPFRGGGGGFPANTLRPGLYLPTKWHLDPPSRLATTGMGRKLGAVPL